MSLNYYASSPTVVLPAQQPQDFFSPHQRAHSPSATGNFRPKYPTPPSLNYLAAVSNASAGRKRSIADVDDPEENVPVGSIVTQVPAKPKQEPVYGPGMTLIYPTSLPNRSPVHGAKRRMRRKRRRGLFVPWLSRARRHA
jgi:hypothetical protein